MREFAFLFLLPLIAITFGCATDTRMTLVKDGKPSAGIVINVTNSTRSAQLAAFELQHVIKLITGTELPIVSKVEDVQGVPILVGESDATRKLKIPAGDFKGEEYLVEFADNRIVLVGNDSPDYGKVNYVDPKTFPAIDYNYRSTTYAVYDFLEKCCNVRFYSFGDDGTAFEKRLTLTIKPVSIRYAPKMDAFRRPILYFHLATNQPPPPRDVQLLQLRWRVNTLFGETGHNIFTIYHHYWGPAKGNWHGTVISNLFIEKRPEYFAQGYAGRFATSLSGRRYEYPNDPDLPPQLCTSHPGPVDYFADEAFNVYQGKHLWESEFTAMPKMPGKPWYYPIQEDDSSYWCLCDKCQKCFPNIAPELRYDYIHFDWINRIAIAAAKLDPAVGISTLAYSGTLPYPDPKVLKLQPNVAVQMCLGIQSWFHPHIYSRQHGAYKDWVTNEVSKRSLFVWTYMLCPAWDAKLVYKYDHFFPVLYPWHVGPIFKEFARDGIRGWLGEINPTFHLLEAYVANKVCFDPSVDTDQLIDEYFALYYGHAAEPMRRFYRTIEDITWNIANYPPNTLKKFPGGSFTYGIYTEKVSWHLGTPERMAELQKLIDQAEKQATTPLEKQRVKCFVDNIWAQAVPGPKAFEAHEKHAEKERAVPIPWVSAGYAGECDGVLEKVDFNEAAKSGGWTLIDGNELATKPELSLASDSKYFYLKYHETGATALKHQNADIWLNSVEIYLAAQPDYPYGQLAMAPNGEFKALRHIPVEGVIKMEDWSVKPVIKNQLDTNGWTLTMAIPLKELLPDRAVAPGGKIYANFMRTRQFDNQTSWSWSPIFESGYAQSLDRMGQLFIAPLAQEGLLPINGDFKSSSGALPDGWTQNKGKDFEPLGQITLDNGRVNIISTGKPVHLSNQKIFPARRGDQIIFEFTAQGKGSGAVGAYFYFFDGNGANTFDGTNAFAGSRFNNYTVTSEPQQYKIILPVANIQPSRFTANFRPVLAATPGSQVEYSQLKVYVIPRGK